MLTYIEPCGWCSSSISSTKCPSNLDKSTESCPNHSPSFASTSLISNSDSISTSTGSLSSDKRRRSSTCMVRSSAGHPNDYYTTKRIDELHERMDDIQITSFLKFINYHLSLKKDPENLHINDLIKDLSNGHILIDLIEILSSTKLKREYGHTRFHSISNVQYVLDYLKLRLQHINISPIEIVSGNQKQILALLWIIMKTFDFPGFRLTNKNCFVENTLLGFGQDRSIILKWLNHIINQSLNTEQIYIKDFSLQTWINGYYFSIILQYTIPLSLKYFTLKCFDYLKELNSSEQERFQICLNLSNYCFNTNTILDYTDQTDKCLFKYFTEFQENILTILKTNHIGKLIQINPYAKQILDTVTQTAEHSSRMINDHEEYLVCIEDEKDRRLTLNSMDHLTSILDQSSNLRTEEKSRLVNGEEEQIKFERTNRREKTENLQSDSHMTNGHNESSKAEQIEDIIDKPQQQHFYQNLEQCVSTVAEEDTEQIPVTNIENPLNGILEHPIIEGSEPEQFIRSNEENHDDKSEEIEQSVEKKNFIITDAELSLEEPTQPVVFNEKLDQSATEEPQQEAFRSNEEDEQTIDEYEKLEQTATLAEQIEQSTVAQEEQKQLLMFNEKVEQPEIEIKPLEQTTLAITENEPPIDINDKLEQSLIGMEEVQQPITSIEETNERAIEHQQLEQPIVEESSQSVISNPETAITSIENNHYLITNEKLEQPSQFVVSNPEAAITPIENNHYVLTNEKLEQAIVEQPSQAVVSNEENTMKIIDNKTSVTSNGVLEQPFIKVKETKPFIVEHEKLDRTSIPIEKIEQFIGNKPLESQPCVTLDKETEQTSVTVVKNNPPPINGKVEPSTIKESPPVIILNEKTTAAPVETKPPVITSKKLEKPVVIESQQPIALNGQVNKSMTANKKSAVTNNKPTSTASSIQGNQHSTTSNEQLTQSTIVVKEPEQRRATMQLPEPTAATAFRCTKYSDIVSKQLPKTNNKPVQATGSFKKQEQSTVSKNKVMPIEKPKQFHLTIEETKQVPLTSAVKESEQSEVPLETQDQSTTIAIEETCVSGISNEETKKPSTKNKKSRRSNAKKGKPKNSPVKTEHPPQSVIQNKEDIEPSLPPPNIPSTIQEQEPSNIQNSSTTPTIPSDDSTSIHHANTQTSSALRSRKNKNKKKLATTTSTLVEKSSSPILPTPSSNRNFFLVIKERLCDRQLIAFKYVFILVCLCFAIIILVLSHK